MSTGSGTTRATRRAQIEGFYKRDELELLIQRRTSAQAAGEPKLSTRKIVERPYQTPRHPQRSRGASSSDGERKALLVMATGSGKTRTVIALVDLLMRAGWVKRVLFLADRVALVNQAAGAFKAHLPDAAPVNLVTERTGEGRVFLSTYPTMMNLIDGKHDGQRAVRRRAISTSIVIDEAHRSVYQRYRRDLRLFRLASSSASPRRRRTRSTTTPIRCSTSRTACRPTPIRSTRRWPTAISCRRSRSRCRSRSCAPACATTICRRRKKTSGTCWNGTRTKSPTASKPPRSTSGCSTSTRSTRSSPI